MPTPKSCEGTSRSTWTARPLALDLIDSHFPSIESIRKGEGAISLELSAIIPALPAGAHHLRYRNSHHADIGAYLANVLAPENPRVAIAAQKRDIEQRQLVSTTC